MSDASRQDNAQSLDVMARGKLFRDHARLADAERRAADAPAWSCEDCHRRFPVEWNIAADDWRVVLPTGRTEGLAFHAMPLDAARCIPCQRRFDLQRIQGVRQAQADAVAASWPGRFRGARFTHLDGKRRAAVEPFFAAGGPRMLYLHGPVDTGKSYAAYAMAHEAMVRGWETPVIWFVPHLFRRWRADMGTSATADLTRTPRLMVLDEIGMRATGMCEEGITEIINARYDDGLPTICTGNPPPADTDDGKAKGLASIWTPRLARRIAGADALVKHFATRPHRKNTEGNA